MERDLESLTLKVVDKLPFSAYSLSSPQHHLRGNRKCNSAKFHSLQFPYPATHPLYEKARAHNQGLPALSPPYAPSHFAAATAISCFTMARMHTSESS
jgi:hypothetical protein